MWPQLEAILRAWVFGRRLEQGGTLLVPSWTARDDERRLRDIHRLLDRVAKRAGLGAGAPIEGLSSHLLRRPAADARPRRARLDLHGGARAGPRLG